MPRGSAPIIPRGSAFRICLFHRQIHGSRRRAGARVRGGIFRGYDARPQCWTAGAVSTLCRISCSAMAFVPALEVADVLASEILLSDIEFRNFLGRMHLAVFGGIVILGCTFSIT